MLEDDGFTAEVEEIVELAGENQPIYSFSCNQCDKVCKPQRGFKQDTKTLNTNSQMLKRILPGMHQRIYTSSIKVLKKKIYIYIYIRNSDSKLALDECYSEKTQKEFVNYESQLMMQIIHTSLFEMLLANLKAC